MTDHPDNYSIKEIVTDTNKKIDKFIEKVERNQQVIDNRIDTLERSWSKFSGSMLAFRWIMGFVVAGGVTLIVKSFIF